MKGIKCLFCNDYALVFASDKDWFLCLSCGVDYEVNKLREMEKQNG
jgi:hypothetical protein